MCFGGGEADKPKESASKLAMAEAAAYNIRKYGELYVPIENQFINDATSSFDLAADGSQNAAYQDAIGQSMGRANEVYGEGIGDAQGLAFGRGLDPTSGAFMAESDALRSAQAKAMGEVGTNAGNSVTTQGFQALENVTALGRGLETTAYDSMSTLAQNEQQALEGQADKDFARSSSIANIAGTAGGIAYGLNRKSSGYA